MNVLATTLAKAAIGQVGLSHGSNNTTTKSRKRQEIIFLRDDSSHKRNREGETMANIEKHGKSLSAEGNIFKGAPKVNNYDNSSDYQGPALKEQSASKDKGPPEIQENEKKSDAYEVVSDNDHNNYAASPAEDETPKIIKISRHKGDHVNRIYESDQDSASFTGQHRSGLHIVSEGGDNDDDDELGDKDARLYGSIGSPVPMPIRRHKSHFRARQRHLYYPNDYMPPNVVSVSQDALTGLQDEGQSREEIFPIFRRHNPLSFSQLSQLTQPQELMQPFQPLSPKSMSVGERPNMFLLPVYNGRAGSDTAVVPITAQNAFPAAQTQLGATPMEYSSSPTPATFTNGLLMQSALQVPLLQSQSVNPTFDLPPQTAGQFLFNNQQPDVRSLYQLQPQPQVQIPQDTMSQIVQPQQFIIPAQMQMTSDVLGSARQQVTRLPSRWVDEDGRGRSEVLDGQRDRSNDDGSQDNRSEDNDDDDEEATHESSRYYDKEDDSRREDEGADELDQTQDYAPERSYSRDDDRSSEEEGEDTEEPEGEPAEDATGRYGSLGRNYAATDNEEGPDTSSPEEDDDDDQDIPPQENAFSRQRNTQQYDRHTMQRFLGRNQGFNFHKLEPPSTPMDAQTFSRYQLTSPSSALKEHILPTTQEPRPTPDTLDDSHLKVSQMSQAEAQFLENKATMQPLFAPRIASKDTIPGKNKKLRFGLGNVLIRLNGRPLEDSSQLRSKIINGQIIQGKGKLVKSKGPVRVKLSHTKDSRHLKIIDIIAPKQSHVYDTKSKIRKPTNVLNESNKTDTKMDSLPHINTERDTIAV